jgi:hypothetical protein
MRLPLAGAGLAGLSAAVTARLAPSELAALLASGTVALVIVGALAYHARADLMRLRRRGLARPQAHRSHASAAARPVARAEGGGSAAAFPRDWEPAGVNWQGPGDSTGPIPLPRERAAVSRGFEVLPLYQATVQAVRWDPADTGPRRAADGSWRPGDGSWWRPGGWGRAGGALPLDDGSSRQPGGSRRVADGSGQRASHDHGDWSGTIAEGPPRS